MAKRPKLSDEEIEEKVAEACKRIVYVKSSQRPPDPIVLKMIVKKPLPEPAPIAMKVIAKTRVEPPQAPIHIHVVTPKTDKGGEPKRKRGR